MLQEKVTGKLGYFLLRVSGSMWPPKFKQYLVVFLISLVRLSACHGGIRMSSLLVITRHGEATLWVNVRASKLSILFNRLSICNALCGKRLAAIALASNASVYSAL